MTNHMPKKLLNIGMVMSVCLLASLAGSAQTATDSISADITADKQAILIGEPVRLTLTVRSSSASPVFPQIPDSLPHFEVLSKSKVDTITDQRSWQLQQVITLTSFDSGHWVIPSFGLAGTNIITDSLAFDVGYIPMKPQDQVRDIKDIIPVTVKLPWLIIILSGVLLIVLVVLFIRALRSGKIKGIKAPFSASDPPFDEAIKALEALSIPVATADVKPFYTSLDNILKRFLSREYQLKAMQFTTSDLLSHLQDVLRDPGELSALAEVLRLGDAVKFAKFLPGSEWHPKALERIRTSIQIIHKIEKTS
jgi:hypothetical protein